MSDDIELLRAFEQFLDSVHAIELQLQALVDRDHCPSELELVRGRLRVAFIHAVPVVQLARQQVASLPIEKNLH